MFVCRVWTNYVYRMYISMIKCHMRVIITNVTFRDEGIFKSIFPRSSNKKYFHIKVKTKFSVENKTLLTNKKKLTNKKVELTNFLSLDFKIL